MDTFKPPGFGAAAVKQSIAVIGAGIAGLACAHRLADAGRTVKIFDKGRAPGGRVATRRIDGGGSFDHGAAYFTAREPGFAAVVAGLGADVALWDRDRYVGMPRMSAMPRAMAKGLDAASSTRITQITKGKKGWMLTDERSGSHGPYDVVVVALPAPQAAELLAGPAPELAAQAREAEFAPCWAVMAAWQTPQGIAEAVYEDADDTISWAARESARPGRVEGERWVLHGSADWSRIHVESSPEAVATALLAAFTGLTGVALAAPDVAVAHRWRYARVTKALGVDHLANDDGLLACGDWCLGARVESAWLSGTAAAGRLLGG